MLETLKRIVPDLLSSAVACLVKDFHPPSSVTSSITSWEATKIEKDKTHKADSEPMMITRKGKPTATTVIRKVRLVSDPTSLDETFPRNREKPTRQTH